MRLMKLLGPALAASILAFTVGCAGHDDGKKEGAAPSAEETGKPKAPEPPKASAKIQVAVASVQLQDDCPSPEPMEQEAAKPTASRGAPSRRERMGDEAEGDVAPDAVANDWGPECVQSTVQISIESEAEEAVPFAIRTVRLKKADGGDVLSTMKPREPNVWKGSKYEQWDESIAAGSSSKVVYSLGDPDWAKVEKVVGSSWGPLYIVELEVEIGGEVRTIVSPKVPRDEPEHIVT